MYVFKSSDVESVQHGEGIVTITLRKRDVSEQVGIGSTGGSFTRVNLTDEAYARIGELYEAAHLPEIRT